MRLMAFLLVFSALFCGKALPSPFRPMTSQELSDRILSAYNKIEDLSVDIHLKFKMSNPGYKFGATGTFFYKQPSKTMLQLHGGFMAERFAKEEETIKATNILAALRKNITQEYEARILSQTVLRGQNCYKVELIPKKKENIAKIFIWINVDRYTMPLVVMQYRDGSKLTQHKQYMLHNNVYVVQKMQTLYVSPEKQLKIQTSFENYRVNEGIPDTVFENQPPSNLISPF